MNLLIAFAFSYFAQAHVEPGLYKGTRSDGTECAMTAGEGFFDNNTPHPLNERIPVSVAGKNFVLAHPPVIDSNLSLVSFNHDLFHGILPNSSGAEALEVAMEHSPSYEGPRSFVWIQNNWKTKERESYKCSDLKLTK